MMGHGGAAGMSVDSMVRDMRNRFLVAAAFSVPISLWSPIGRNVLGFTVAAPFGLRDDVWLLLSLPVIFYSSWIFFDGAVAALRPPVCPSPSRLPLPSIARWGPTSSPACCSRSPTR
jgi:Cu2+-exporting ATPase